MTDNNNNTTHIDIFAPPPPAPEDEQTIALKCDVDKLRVQLHAMIKSVPALLTTCVRLTLERKINVQLTDAKRQDSKTGNDIHDNLQRQVSTMKEATAIQVDKAAQAKLQAEQECHTQVENDLTATVEEEEEEALNTIYKNEEWGDLQEEAQENDAQENSDKDVELYQPPIKGSSRVYCMKKITPCILSDPDLEILDTAPKTAVPVLPKKKTPCMSAKKDTVNTVPCEKCASTGRTCYSAPLGMVCWDSKGKGKQKSTPPANPTSAPPVTATSAPKPGPTLKARLAPVPKLKAPGPVGTLWPYIKITVNHKRKAIEIEEDSSESEQDNDNDNDAEDAYMAGRVNGLHTFVSMFEKAFGVLKKEVTEIDVTSVVSYCGKPGQFWPDDQEPLFEGQKHCDIELYHNYLDYNGTDEEDQFDMDKDDVLSPPIVAPVPPPHMDEDDIISPPTVAPITPSVIIHVPVGKWVNTDKPLDPEDLNLLSVDIPQEVCSMLLPSDDDLPVKELVDFKLPDIDTGCFTQTGASCFHQAHPDKDLDLARDISPKSWVYSLQESFNDMIWDGKWLILHL
ncbi:hypothetical protein EV702DRAFT_1045333 [Suillus placidus]|uniref:Uncharacterized protein n=1 Tax=Suillus placidus TaxID=48579 RepID=A0A9P6ZVS7_9AGAM|nr:hypothetical protein EV702DRAFT_1045333 [Suillus placidus]